MSEQTSTTRPGNNSPERQEGQEGKRIENLLRFTMADREHRRAYEDAMAAVREDESGAFTDLEKVVLGLTGSDEELLKHRYLAERIEKASGQTIVTPSSAATITGELEPTLKASDWGRINLPVANLVRIIRKKPDYASGKFVTEVKEKGLITLATINRSEPSDRELDYTPVNYRISPDNYESLLIGHDEIANCQEDEVNDRLVTLLAEHARMLSQQES